jgi:hypothetical protein
LCYLLYALGFCFKRSKIGSRSAQIFKYEYLRIALFGAAIAALHFANEAKASKESVGLWGGHGNLPHFTESAWSCRISGLEPSPVERRSSATCSCSRAKDMKMRSV